MSRRTTPATEFAVTRLDNGVRVATSPLPHVQSVTLGIWVGMGSRFEPRELGGVSHFIEHLLFKGTRRRSAKQISEEIEGRGGYLNAFTQEENTCYYARVPDDQAWRALDVLGDMFLDARFAAQDVEKERGVILEEIQMYRDQPQHEVYDILTAMLWPDHPLGRPIVGADATVKGMRRRDIVAFRRAKYVPGNTVVVIAGKCRHDECVAKVAALLDGEARAATPVAARVTARVGQGRSTFQAREIEQTHLAMGIRLFGRQDERRYALRLLSAILGENMSSRLFQIVRERHGLAYSVSSGTHLFRETGAMSISAGLDRKNLPKALRLIARETRRLKEQPVPAGELRRAKEYLVGQIRLGLESTSNRMMWLGEHLLAYGRPVAPEEAVAAINRVTASEILELARDIFRARALSVAVVSPELTADVKRQSLEEARAL